MKNQPLILAISNQNQRPRILYPAKSINIRVTRKQMLHSDYFSWYWSNKIDIFLKPDLALADSFNFLPKQKFPTLTSPVLILLDNFKWQGAYLD